MMGDPVGARWSLWRTTNSGASWDSTGLYLPQAGSEAGYNNCLSVAGSRIWFGTNNTRIYNTTNNGASWVIQNVSPYTSITSIWFDENGSSTGYCGGDSILKTTNYGTNWFSIGGPGTGLIVGVAGLTMWGGNVWYVRSGSPIIYFGFGTGQWMIDNTAPAGTYRHVATDRIPNFPYLAFAVRTNGGISYKQVFVQGIKMVEGSIPEKFYLGQNYPNPFNPVTKIRFVIPPAETHSISSVQLIVFDMLGREITTLVNERLNPGTYEVSWDASNYPPGGGQVPSGVYFYKLIVGDNTNNGGFTETKKMVLIK
ncbi:MAG: T9SS type A sorting domain-containing protein [Chlorobi bacterium]|nr:T9SS type A sorting domain-containing protein [Chlorobiota bacterium]